MMRDQALDLFGEPIRAPRGAGRPMHAPTEQLRQRVRKLHAEGLNQLLIAAAIGLTAPTLRRHYRLDLDFWKGHRQNGH